MLCGCLCVCVCVGGGGGGGGIAVVCGTISAIFFQGGQVDFPSTPTTLISTYFDQIASEILEKKMIKNAVLSTFWKMTTFWPFQN